MRNIKHTKRPWSEQEIAYLSLGHNMGATLKTLSIVLNRTESALNKALVRLGIRQYGTTPRGKKPKCTKMSPITPQRLRQEIAEFAKKQGYPVIFPDQIASKKSAKVSSSLGFFPNPLIKFPMKRQTSIPVWSDLDYAITILKTKGHEIYRNKDYTQTLHGLKVDFWLDGTPLTAAQLLVRANRIRLEQGLEAFYVESITEH